MTSRPSDIAKASGQYGSTSMKECGRSSVVGLLGCDAYRAEVLAEKIAMLFDALGFGIPRGSKILLKPNLISNLGHDGLAVTHPQVIAAVATWFRDHGCLVHVGDSPAFGTAGKVASAQGVVDALRGLDVTIIDLDSPVDTRLPCGASAPVSQKILEYDLLVNMPKVKAHSQMLLSLAVKNLYGTLSGWRKPALHLRHGASHDRFARFIVGLLSVLPQGISLADGVTAMHETGPISGRVFALNVLGASLNPVALDAALISILGLSPERSPIWRECRRLDLPGWDVETLSFPLQRPEHLQARGFIVPNSLKPVRFHPAHVARSALKRLYLAVKGSGCKADRA